jgi:hypothetical protein
VTPVRASTRARIAIFLAWACAVVAVTARHEPWRDEVRAYMIATSTASLGDLFRELRADGHPALWHLLLRGAHALAPVPAVLPAVSLLVAAAAVVLFVVRSPFGPPVLVLFPFSVFPLYEYSVMARNYGVSLLLCFAFASLYRDRTRWRPLLALILVLLANTNAHAAFLTAALAFVWCVDELREGPEPRRVPRAALPIVAATLGLAFAAWTAFSRPDVTTHRGLPSTAASLRAMVFDGGGGFLAAPLRAPAILDFAVFLLLAAGFARRPSRLFAAAGATLGFYTFFLAVYPGDLRHVGLLLVLFLTLLWIEEDRPPSAPARPVARDLSRFAFGAVLPVVLAMGVAAGIVKITTDLSRDMSASRPAAAFIKSRPDLSEAVLLGEPDYALEPFPYYVANPIYISREGRYGSWVSFTTKNRDANSLGEILDAAGRIRQETGRPVLLLFQPLFVEPGPQNVWKYSYEKKTFTRSAVQLERFQVEAAPIGRFVDTPQVDERYAVFQMRDRPSSGASR